MGFSKSDVITSGFSRRETMESRVEPLGPLRKAQNVHWRNRIGDNDGIGHGDQPEVLLLCSFGEI